MNYASFGLQGQQGTLNARKRTKQFCLIVQNKIRLIVSEVSSFVGNPVTTKLPTKDQT